MPRDAKLVDGDLQAFNTYINEDELILQKMSIRLKTWLGEWILNRNLGIQYARFFMQKPPRISEFTSLIRLELEDIEGVSRMKNIETDYNNEERTLTISGRVELINEERAIQISLSTDELSVDFI